MNSQSQIRPAINQDVSLARLGGDRNLLKTLAEFFLDDAPALLDQLRDAHQLHDFPTMAHRAHSLKGLSSTFEALPFQELAFDVETMARARDTQILDSTMCHLTIEFDRLIASLREVAR